MFCVSYQMFDYLTSVKSCLRIDIMFVNPDDFHTNEILFKYAIWQRHMYNVFNKCENCKKSARCKGVHIKSKPLR